MMQPLNIPLKETTRHTAWRVVWPLLCVILAVFLAYSLFRAVTYRDTTSSLAPELTEYTARFTLHGPSKALFSSHLGQEMLIPGGPWTLKDLIVWSNGNFSLHMAKNQTIGVSFQGSLPEQSALEAQNLGFFVWSKGKTTYLGREPANQAKKTRFSPRMILPWVHGELLHEKRAKSIHISKKGITIAAGQRLQVATTPSAAEESEIIALISPENIENISSALNYEPLPEAFIQDIQQNGARILIALDHLGLVYSLTVESSRYTIDDLVRIGREIMNRKTLTTTALTFTDGDSIDEIRTNSEHINSTISAEENLTLITFENEQGDVARISKTDDTITLSNRKISQEIGSFLPNSLCLQRAHSFARLSELLAISKQTGAPTPRLEHTSFSTWPFSEVAISNRKTRFCW